MEYTHRQHVTRRRCPCPDSKCRITYATAHRETICGIQWTQEEWAGDDLGFLDAEGATIHRVYTADTPLEIAYRDEEPTCPACLAG